jgi:hypothetical protein
MGENEAITVDERGGRLVAGGFESEDQGHGALPCTASGL